MKSNNFNQFEVLVHNVSHSDLVLTAINSNLDPNEKKNSVAVTRPKFSHFREITRLIWEGLENNYSLQDYNANNSANNNGKNNVEDSSSHSQVKISSYLKHNRRVSSEDPYQYEVTPNASGDYVPVGFDLSAHPVAIDDVSSLRFRRDDKSLISTTDCSIDSANFPLLAMLIPKWLSIIQYHYRSNCKLILYFVTGRGTPNDTSARIIDNSTHIAGKLMKLFVECIYPFIEVRMLHSQTNIFRYDENIIFVKKELIPSIDAIRNELTKTLSSEQRWKDHLRVTLSFADGSSARVSAINASLKHYRPDYMHFWQLKTFWSELKICDDDIEWHTHEEISTETAMSLDSVVNTDVGDLVEEMRKFVDVFQKVRQLPQNTNDLSSFWLRKTKKPVLAILLVEKNGLKKFYRGCNMEVSMPTGSLCAERNAIGSALADDLSLKREDLKMIAVFSPNTISSTKPLMFNPLLSSPSADSSEGIVFQTRGRSLSENLPNSVSSSPKMASGSNFLNLFLETPKEISFVQRAPSNDLDGKSSPVIGHKRKILNTSLIRDSAREEMPSNMPHSKSLKTNFVSPLPTLNGSIENRSNRRVLSNIKHNITSFSNDESCAECGNNNLSTLRPQEDNKNLNCVTPTIIQVDDNDLNPIKPCGACNEWLKKIAEINPSFLVVTFTDVSCRGVYVEQITD